MASVDGFSSLNNVPRHQFDEAMQVFLRLIETEFKTYAQSPGASAAFMQGPDLLFQLTPLTGLNDVSFVCKNEFPVEHVNGAVEIEKRLAGEIIALCYSEGLPQQALITGNTEQRYMRVLFLRDYDQMFQLSLLGMRSRETQPRWPFKSKPPKRKQNSHIRYDLQKLDSKLTGQYWVPTHCSR